MQKPVITLVGHTCIDNNIVDGVSYENWGSPAMYMAHYYLKNFGIKSCIVSSYGHDFAKYTSDFTFTEQPGDGKTLVYENIVNNGQRVQYCHNSQSSLPAPLSERAIGMLQKTDILIVAPQLPNYSLEYLAKIMQYAPDGCLKALLPQGYMRQIDHQDMVNKREFVEASRILPYFDVVIASDEDYTDILTLAADWGKYKPGSSIVITQADKGARVFHSGETRQIPTRPIPFADIKNPVGSGDIFSAQFALSLYDKLDPYAAANQANRATAKALTSK